MSWVKVVHLDVFPPSPPCSRHPTTPLSLICPSRWRLSTVASFCLSSPHPGPECVPPRRSCQRNASPLSLLKSLFHYPVIDMGRMTALTLSLTGLHPSLKNPSRQRQNIDKKTEVEQCYCWLCSSVSCLSYVLWSCWLWLGRNKSERTWATRPELRKNVEQPLMIGNIWVIKTQLISIMSLFGSGNMTCCWYICSCVCPVADII